VEFPQPCPPAEAAFAEPRKAPLCIIVEDHEDTREGYAEYLAASGFASLTASNADELYRLVVSNTPDAIVLDLQLPGTDGWEVTRRLKSDPRLQGVPIIAVSGCVLPAERERAEEAGCDAFVGKPCDPAQIVSEVQRLIQGKPAAG
jgi:two-component system cell cycle response regulator DivK